MELITLKQFAKDQNITYEAVRRQVVRYSDDLKGHVIKQDRTQYLDKDAVAFLQSRRRESPVVMVTMDQSDEIKRLKEEMEILKNQLMAAQAKVIEMQAEEKKMIEERVRYQFLQEDNLRKDEQLQESIKRISMLQSEKDRAWNEIENLRRERDQAQSEAQSYTKSIFGFYRKKT